MSIVHGCLYYAGVLKVGFHSNYFTVKNNRTTWDIRVYLGTLLKKTQIRKSIVYKMFRTNTELIPTVVVVFGILTDGVFVLPRAVKDIDLVGEGEKVEGSV